MKKSFIISFYKEVFYALIDDKILVDSVISLNIIKITENINKRKKSIKVKKIEQQGEKLLELDTTDQIYFVQSNKNAKHYDSSILFYKKGTKMSIDFRKNVRIFVGELIEE